MGISRFSHLCWACFSAEILLVLSQHISYGTSIPRFTESNPIENFYPGPRPNILFIVADDLRHDAIGYFDSQVITPNIDELYRNGFHFTNAYSQGGLCVPSRIMILTGRDYLRAPIRENDWNFVHGPNVTMGHTFRYSGYKTYCVSKIANSFRFGHHQFEEYEEAPHRFSGNAFPEAAKTSADHTMTWLQEKHTDNRPFFIYSAPPVPHDPFVTERMFHELYEYRNVTLPANYMSTPTFRHGNGGSRDEGLYARPLREAEMVWTLKDYYAIITAFDHHLGRVFAKLKEDKMWNNTIIAFTSDQGLAVGGRHGMNGKSTLYEEYKSPLVFYGPGIKQGSSSALVYLFDIYPTLCELASIPKPSWLSGSSLVRFFTPEHKPANALAVGNGVVSVPPWRQYLFCLFAASQGLLARMVRDEEWKLIWYPNLERFSLFNLKDDPHELHEITDQSAANLSVMQRMKGLMIEEQLYWRDTFLANASNTFAPFPQMRRDIEALEAEKLSRENELDEEETKMEQNVPAPVTMSFSEDDLQNIREDVKKGIVNGAVYVYDLFASDPAEMFLRNTLYQLTSGVPVYIIFSRINDIRIGNTIGQLIQHLACAHMAGLHAIVINHDWVPTYGDEATTGHRFVESLCSVHVHPSPTSREAARAVVSRDCNSSAAPWYWEDPDALWTKFVPQLREVFKDAFSSEIFTDHIRSDSHYMPRRRKNDGQVESSIPANLTMTNRSPTSKKHVAPSILVYPNEAVFPLIPNVLVQLRCSDNFATSMGILPFHAIFDIIHAYRDKVIYETNETAPKLYIYISSEADVLLQNAPLKNYCPYVVSLLLHELVVRFPGTIVSVQRGRVFHTWYMMNQADVVICAASTFCLWPSLSNRKGTVYLPITNLFGRKHRIDFGPAVHNVHFITDYKLYGIVPGRTSIDRLKSHLLARPHHSKKRTSKIDVKL